MSGIGVRDRVTSLTKFDNEGATPDMDKDRINWPVVVLVLGIAGMTLAAIVTLSLHGRSTEAVLTTIMGLLAAFGFYQHSSTQKDLGAIKQQGDQVVSQTNGRMTQMQTQQDEMIKMIRDLALRVPPPEQTHPASSSQDSVSDPNADRRDEGPDDGPVARFGFRT